MALPSTIGVLALFTIVGCGGDGGSGGNPGPADGSVAGPPSPFCAEYCALTAEVACPNDSEDACRLECTLEQARYPACDDLHQTAYECLLGASSDVFECNASGKAQIRSGAALCSLERKAILDCYIEYAL